MSSRHEPSLSLWVEGRATGRPVRLARSAWSRARGLLWGRDAARGVIVVLSPCSAIHTFGMRRAIDVVFTDASGRVRRLCPGVRPCSVVLCRGAAMAWEAPAGTAAVLAIRHGDRLEARGA